MGELCEHDHAAAVALFRSQVIGPLVRRDFAHGELRRELLRLSKQPFRPPDSKHTRCYSIPTLERWLAAWRRGGLDELRPRSRNDKGRGRGLEPKMLELLLDIRREYPSASARLIISTLEYDGRLMSQQLSPRTLNRLYEENGLGRARLPTSGHTKVRLRWQADLPGTLWHGDVCHGPLLKPAGQATPLRIHALLDDASRRIIAIEARSTETEADMLELMVGALRRHGRPDILYLDNGSTYRGNALAQSCAKLNIALVHAQPYDPQARGKMERFWRTLREGCLDFVGESSTLHDVNLRLWAFVDEHYHKTPHAGLMGNTPERAWEGRLRPELFTSEEQLRAAFERTERRRLRSDSTISFDGRNYELEAAFLAGKTVNVGYCSLDKPIAPWVEHEGRKIPLHLVDPLANARRTREQLAQTQLPEKAVQFEPTEALLDKALRRRKPGSSIKRRQGEKVKS